MAQGRKRVGERRGVWAMASFRACVCLWVLVSEKEIHVWLSVFGAHALYQLT